MPVAACRVTEVVMFSERVGNLIQRGKLVTATPQATVSEAARLMAGRRIGAILVLEDELLVGIFTERDVVFRVVAKGRDPAATCLADVMTVNPITIGPDRSFGHALALMHENGFRHMPIVEHGKPVGIVSARNALDPDLEEFVSESNRREQFMREGH